MAMPEGKQGDGYADGASRAERATTWHQVPAGPRALVADMISVSHRPRDLAQATALRKVLPEAHIMCRSIDSLPVKLARFFGLEEIASDDDVVQALATQRVCDTLAVSDATSADLRLIARAFERAGHAWSGLHIDQTAPECDDGLEAVVKSLPISKMKSLNICDAQVNEASKQVLLAFVSTQDGLQDLGLTGERAGHNTRGLDDASAAQVIGALQHCRSLRELSVYVLGLAGVRALCNVLPTLVNLKSLYLASCPIETAEGVLLGRALQPLKTIRELVLRDCELDAGAGVALGEMLQNSPLMTLNLDLNRRIGDAGVTGIAAGLAHSKLRVLILDNCDLGPQAAQALGKALESSALFELGLARNFGIGDTAGALLIKGVQSGASLRKLRINDCGLGLAAAEALGVALRAPNSELRELVLFRNESVGDRGGVHIASALACNTKLRVLNLGQCEVGVATARAVGEALQAPGCALRKLGLAFNLDIGAEGGQLVMRGRDGNTRLHELDLGGSNVPGQPQTRIKRTRRGR